MIINAQRTIYGIDLNLCQLVGRDYKYLPNTTLNEKFGLSRKLKLTKGQYPILNYYTIGVGGNGLISKKDSGYSYNTHSPVDAGLFEHVPFIMRDVNNDLTISERSRYRLRVVETINNKSYACYYLMMIPTINMKDYFYHVTNENGVNKLNVFDTNKASLLSPIPIDKSSKIKVNTTAEYVAKIAKLDFALYNNDLKELFKVFEIRNIEHRRIKEIGVCMGIEESGNGYTEAYGVQIAFHVSVDINMAMYLNASKNVLRAIEIGGNESLIYG